MSRRGLTLLVSGGLLVVLAIVALVLPVPYVVFVPGEPTDTLGVVADGSGNAQVISVSGGTTYPTTGHLYLTTVGLIPGSCDRDPTLQQALRAWFDKHDAVQPKQVICPPGTPSAAVQQQNADEMAQSQQDAITAALLYLHYKVKTQRISVGDLGDKTPAAAVLRIGDQLLTINGKPVTNVDVLHNLISGPPVGTKLTLSINRHGRVMSVTARTVAEPSTGRPILGFSPDLAATFVNAPSVHIGIDPTSVGGPSAGLAFTLGIIDKLTPGDLTGGKTIAGTGTMNGFGIVGPIGGIQQKIAGAVAKGATVFLAPASECADAVAAAPKSLTLVKVDTLATAVKALQAIAAGSTNFPRC
jgi:PDZ domain-containing protein